LPQKSNTTKTILDCINVDGWTINSPGEILKYFNKHFCNVGKNLSKKYTQDERNKFKSYLCNSVSSSLYLEPPRINEVIINSLKVSKAIGHDNLPP